jgi:hypothetical protein
VFASFSQIRRQRARGLCDQPSARFPYSTGYPSVLLRSRSNVAAIPLSWPKTPPISCACSASSASEIPDFGSRLLSLVNSPILLSRAVRLIFFGNPQGGAFEGASVLAVYASAAVVIPMAAKDCLRSGLRCIRSASEALSQPSGHLTVLLPRSLPSSQLRWAPMATVLGGGFNFWIPLAAATTFKYRLLCTSRRSIPPLTKSSPAAPLCPHRAWRGTPFSTVA